MSESLRVRCVVCGEILSYTPDNTALLLQHLRSKHPCLSIACLKSDTSGCRRSKSTHSCTGDSKTEGSLEHKGDQNSKDQDAKMKSSQHGHSMSSVTFSDKCSKHNMEEAPKSRRTVYSTTGFFSSRVLDVEKANMLRYYTAVVLLCLMYTCTSETDFSETDYNNAVSTRDERFFPFFSVVRIRRTPCTGGNNLRGTCYTRRECSSHGGSPSGTCANGWGVCCILQKTCGGSTNINCTYFSNTGYPATNSTGGRCTFTVNKCNSNVCQLRVDFLDFSLAQPDATGNCINDFLSIMGGASTVPNICGENTNQHVYVDFAAGNSPIQLTVNVNGAIADGRKWNLKVTQIECTSPQRAPTGCLMYYTDTVGKVMSFNYATAQRNLDTFWTRELANLNYGVCVQMVPGYCSIEWSQNPNDPYSFTVSGDTGGLDNTLLGTPEAAVGGSNCTEDYVVIPHPAQNMMDLDYDRFCGNGFIPTTTSSKPFVLTVVTNANEIQPGNSIDNENRGFCLNYRQLPCQ